MKRKGLLTLLLLLPVLVPAQEFVPDLGAVSIESSRSGNDPSRTSFAMWLHDDFWRVALSANKGTTKETLEQFMELVKPYTILIIMDGTSVKPGKKMTFRSEEYFLNNITLQDSRGIEYKPIPPEEYPEGVILILETMKPALTANMGDMGENCQFLVFPGLDDKGRKIFDPRRNENMFLLSRGKILYTWDLPLPSLFPDITCPKCSEVISGMYYFCPWDGTPLRAPDL